MKLEVIQLQRYPLSALSVMIDIEDNGLAYLIRKNCFLYIEAEVIETIISHRQFDEESIEAGGCLLGYYRGSHIHIERCTIPGKKDIATRTRFHRTDSIHVETVKEFHNKTLGYGNYLGEWHTHPQKKPQPSHLDKMEWKKIRKLRAPLPSIFIIVGYSDLWVGLDGTLLRLVK